MKRITALFLCMAAMAVCHAQDVIVKRDGSTIIAKVIEVNQGDIKYKKFSNQNGPTYTVDKSEVMAINYEGGDKDTFDDAKPVQTAANNQTQTMSFGVNPNLEEDNLKLVHEFNAREIEYVGKKGEKPCRTYFGILRIKDGSIIESPEIKTDFFIKRNDKSGYGCDDGLVVLLHNKTNKTIYIDLANCFFLESGHASPYYIPTSTTEGNEKSTGGSVNVGAITGALGIGGTVGTLANGVNVGGGATTINTTTVYSQRIVSIPPSGTLSLEPKSVYHYKRGDTTSHIILQYADFLVQCGIMKEKEDNYKLLDSKLKQGESVTVCQKDNATLSVHISYSFDEKMSETASMRMDFYLSHVVGGYSQKLGFDWGVGFYEKDFIQTPMPPLCFRIWGGKLMK